MRAPSVGVSVMLGHGGCGFFRGVMGLEDSFGKSRLDRVDGETCFLLVSNNA